MNRRESLKTIGLGTLVTGLLSESFTSALPGNTKTLPGPLPAEPGREPFEITRDKKIKEAHFFDAHEMATITMLADIIIPKDARSGSASDAKVPAFIEFIVKDMPDHQTPMRGGLRWVDLQCLNRYGKVFTDCSKAQQIELVDMIAYPKKAKPEMAQGVSFFNRMRDLTASGFFTSEIGVKDIGFAGNAPNKWTGV